jgi:peptide/nickel transport system substrate-binding protein
VCAADSANQLHFALRADPKTLDPLMVTEESGDAISYLTQATLLRINRKTQKAEPALATSWKVAADGKTVTFQLRHGVKFSDGTPFDSADIKYTLDRLLDPVQKVPAGDELRSVAKIQSLEAGGPYEITFKFAAPLADLAGRFDEIPILSSHSTKPGQAVLGPFQVTEYTAGSSLLLSRNPNYWKRDAQGHSLPYLDSIRIDIQQNRDLELARFRRGELHFISVLDADNFERLGQEDAHQAVDAGPALDAEMLWVNQSRQAPIPDYKKAWFASTNFRQALSAAISREAIVKLVYRGAAREAFGPISPAAKDWYHPKLRPTKQDPAAARVLLEKDGFKASSDGQLRDRAGNAVEFSVITNAGNKNRARMAALVQQDLAQVGIRLNIVTLDMGSVVERMMKSLNYEAVLLGVSGTALDPADQASLWMSKSSTHQWNPNQKSPETPWEAEIDGLMQTLSSVYDPAKRKKAADRLQEIVVEQRPLIYLVHPDALVAVSPVLRGVAPVVLSPRVFWNAEYLQLASQVSQNR